MASFPHFSAGSVAQRCVWMVQVPVVVDMDTCTMQCPIPPTVTLINTSAPPSSCPSTPGPAPAATGDDGPAAAAAAAAPAAAAAAATVEGDAQSYPGPRNKHYSHMSGGYWRSISSESPTPAPTSPPRPSSPPHIYEDVAAVETPGRPPRRYLSPAAREIVDMVDELWEEYQGRRYRLRIDSSEDSGEGED